MIDPSQLTTEQLQALIASQDTAQSSTPSSQTALQPNALTQGAYPAPDGYSPTPAQSLTAWQLYNTGGIKPGEKGGTVNYPRFADPQHPPEAGSYIIDQSGNFRLAGQGDTGAAPSAADQSFAHLSTAQLEKMLAEHDGAQSPGLDAAQSIIPGLEKGVAGVAGLPGDLANFYGNGVNWLTAQGENWANKTFHKGLPDQAFTPQDFSGLIKNALPHTSQDFNDLVQGVQGPYYQPQTPAGRTVDTIAQMAPAALMPGGALERLLRVAVPSFASAGAGETARNIAPNDPTAETWARAAGGLLGGAGVGGFEAIKNAPLSLAAKGMEGVTSDHLDQMQALMERAQAMGVNLTPAEALSQVGGGRLAPLQHYVENSHVGGPLVSDFFAARPGQVSGAVGGLADALSPPTSQPSMLGVQAQKAAQGGLDTVRQGINAMAEPAYSALQGQEIPEAEYAALSKSEAYKAGLQAVRNDPILNEKIAGLPDNNLAVVNEVKKQLGQSATAAAQTAMNPKGNNAISSAFSGAGANTDALARALSPEWAAAHDIESGARGAYLDPLSAGPSGQIAATDQVPQQTAALYPSKPLEGAPNETAQAIRLMTGQDPNIAAALTRQHLMNSFNEAGQDLQGGQNQYGGAKWIAQIAGNPEQRATLQTGLQEINPEAASHFDDLSQVLAATGKRMQPGSQTAFNGERHAAFAMAPAPVRGLSALLDPLEIGKHIDNAVGGAMYRRNISSLAEALQANPEEARAFFQKAQKMGGGNPALATALITHAGAQSQ